MQTINTNTFEIQTSDIFDEQKIDYESFSIWTRQEPFKIQMPIINMALSEIQDLYDNYEGNSYKTTLLNYFNEKRYQIERAKNFDIEIAGKKAYLQKANSTIGEGTAAVHLCHYFINIPLDDTFMQEFSADCELSLRDKFEPIFMAAINSIRWIGDFRHFIDIQKVERAKREASIEAMLEKYGKTEKMDAHSGEDSTAEVPHAEFKVPEDGASFCQIGDYLFTLQNPEAAVSIGAFSRKLDIDIEAHCDAAENASDSGLLDEYNRDGMVRIRFGMSGICNNGTPAGEVILSENKCEKPYINASLDGLNFRLRLYARVTLQNGWLGINGKLMIPYATDTWFPVSLALKFDSASLQWDHYFFDSSDDVNGMENDIIRYLRISDAEATNFPPEVLQYRNLVELDLFGLGQNQEVPIDLPDAIGQFSKLEKLTLSRANISGLPAAAGNLKQLKGLFINQCHLAELPSGIWQLPAVEFLYLNHNNLTAIPGNIDMPALKRLEVASNQLQSLPEKLANLPSLNSVNLRHNPWQSLPQNLLDSVSVELDIADKMRLFDFSYHGADNSGISEWDERIFRPDADKDADVIAEFERIVVENDISELKTPLAALLKKSIVFHQSGPDDYSQIGNHRFGGMPDLPATIPYPRFGENTREGKASYIYEFIAQVNCTELHKFQDYLPKSGFLFFFLSSFHDLDGQLAGRPGLVIYFDGSKDALQSGQRFKFDWDDYYDMYPDEGYSPFKAEANKALSLPHFYSHRSNTYLFKDAAAPLLEARSFLEDDFYDLLEEPLATVFGGQHAIHSYGFTQNESPELQAALTYRGKPEDWVILLKVGSEGDFMWGDAGELFYVIHKSDLLKRDFSKVFITIESS
jgi:uncharacterized protein YwqG